jgi:hypothetical protein
MGAILAGVRVPLVEDNHAIAALLVEGLSREPV